MKAYVAGWYRAKEEIRPLREALVARGVAVTSRWLDSADHEGVPGVTNTILMVRYMREDLEDVDAADAVVLYHPRAHHGKGTGGRHVETGYALARGKPVFLVGDAESVFHFHPLVTVLPLLEYPLSDDYLKLIARSVAAGRRL